MIARGKPDIIPFDSSLEPKQSTRSPRAWRSADIVSIEVGGLLHFIDHTIKRSSVVHGSVPNPVRDRKMYTNCYMYIAGLKLDWTGRIRTRSV
jgi:hypothetical protein